MCQLHHKLHSENGIQHLHLPSTTALCPASTQPTTNHQPTLQLTPLCLSEHFHSLLLINCFLLPSFLPFSIFLISREDIARAQQETTLTRSSLATSTYNQYSVRQLVCSLRRFSDVDSQLRDLAINYSLNHQRNNNSCHHLFCVIVNRVVSHPSIRRDQESPLISDALILRLRLLRLSL